jgi:hypothetical protein
MITLGDSTDKDLVDRRIMVMRYESQTTKSPELIFSALLGDDGARDVRLERALRT